MIRKTFFKYPYLSSIIIVLFLIVFPFVFYYYEQKIDILSVYSKLNQNPKSQDRILPLKNEQEYIRILSICGGGIRGIIPTHVLQYLEKTSKKPIAELFDIIVGTSTGAIASVVLTVPGIDNKPLYSTQDLLNFYNQDGQKIFYNPWYHRLLTLDGLIGPKYKTSSRYAVLKKYIGETYNDQLLNNVVIPTYAIEEEKPILFFNWQSTKAEDANYAVVDLLMSAISPPGLFPSVVFGMKGKRFVLVDGAVYANNPELAASLIAMSLYPNKKYILVSLGTGSTDTILPSLNTVDWGMFQWSKNIISLLLNSTMKFNEFILQKLFPFPLAIYHFDTKLGGFDVSLDDVSPRNIQKLNKKGSRLVSKSQDELNELIPRLLHP